MLGRPVAKSTILRGIICSPRRRGGVCRWHHTTRRHSDRSFRGLYRGSCVTERRGGASVLRPNFISKYLPLIFIHEEMYYDSSKKKSPESSQSKGPGGGDAKSAETHASIAKHQCMTRCNSLFRDRRFFTHRAHDLLPHLPIHFSAFEGRNRAISLKK
jgi:hypothetical protein